MNSVLGRLAPEELLGLVVEVVELALEDRDDVPGDVLEDLRVVQRPLLALALSAGGRRGNRFHRGKVPKASRDFLPFIGRTRLGADGAPVAVDRQRREHRDQADAPGDARPTRRCPPARPRTARASASTIVRERVASANAWSHAGIDSGGTNADDANVSGKISMKPSAWARLRRLEISATNANDPRERVAEQEQQPDARDDLERARVKLKPTSRPTHDHDDQRHGVRRDVGERAPGEHRGARHRQRAEAVDQTLLAGPRTARSP